MKENAMSIEAVYAHTNLIARDWRRLAEFYIHVFGCVPVPPERDLSGPALEAATAVPGAHLRGMHLRLPGGDPQHGPTLEIFTYTEMPAGAPPAANRPGFGHLAFRVADVAAACAAVLAGGGSAVGETVSLPVGAGQVTFAYLSDPEGNLLEVQRWN